MDGVGGLAACTHAECPICFEALCEQPVAALLKNATDRACRHFFHHKCIVEISEFSGTADGVCPMCRAAYTSIIEMPDPMSSAEKWFQLVDADSSGNLTLEEVVDVVRATCNISEDDVETLVQEKWGKWDADSSKGIEWNEFPGLLSFIFGNLPDTAFSVTPNITGGNGSNEWFDFWDEDKNGALDKDEVARALIKTFGKNGFRTVKELQAVIESVWPLFDPDHSNTITKDEFLIRDGLADTICACLLNQGKWTLSPQLSPCASPPPAESPPAAEA